MKRGRMTVNIQLTVTTLGHENVFEPGTLVKVRNPASLLFGHLESLDIDDDLKHNRKLRGHEAGVGTVISSTYHLSEHNLVRSTLDKHAFVDEENPREKRVMLSPTGAFAEQWYCVLFGPGLFWARYDWITDDLEEPL